MSRGRARRPAAAPGPVVSASVVAALEEIYAELPDIDCLGRCADSCHNIDMTGVERQRIADTAGVVIPRRTIHDEPVRCVALTMFNRCAVHAIRPLICRLWGLTRGMRCSYGCIPHGGYLPDEAVIDLIIRVHEAAGEHERAAQLRAGVTDGLLDAWVSHVLANAREREINSILDAKKRGPV